MKRFAVCTVFLCAALMFAVASPSAAEESHTNSIGMEFVLIPAGAFMMGADKNDEKARGNETPQHTVTISKPFYLGKFEVTRTQWTAVMGSQTSPPQETLSLWRRCPGMIHRSLSGV